MANYSKDWRDTERDLSELPDAQLREALAQAGVKAVLPSHKKPRGLVKPVGRLGDATSRWAAGDWEERISLDELPDAQKFLDDPLKPPTIAMAQATALSSAPGAVGPWRGVLLGLAATAALAGLTVFALKESDLLERPRLGARSVQTPSAAAGAAASETPTAQPSREALNAEPAMAAPAGSSDHNEANAEARAKQLEALTKKARQGDETAMLDVARAMLKDGDADGAMRWAGRARRADRRSIEARIVLGDAQMLAGYGKAATQTWRGALARSPNNKELKRRLGEW